MLLLLIQGKLKFWHELACFLQKDLDLYGLENSWTITSNQPRVLKLIRDNRASAELIWQITGLVIETLRNLTPTLYAALRRCFNSLCGIRTYSRALLDFSSSTFSNLPPYGLSCIWVFPALHLWHYLCFWPLVQTLRCGSTVRSLWSSSAPPSFRRGRIAPPSLRRGRIAPPSLRRGRIALPSLRRGRIAPPSHRRDRIAPPSLRRGRIAPPSALSVTMEHWDWLNFTSTWSDGRSLKENTSCCSGEILLHYIMTPNIRFVVDIMAVSHLSR